MAEPDNRTDLQKHMDKRFLQKLLEYIGDIVKRTEKGKKKEKEEKKDDEGKDGIPTLGNAPGTAQGTDAQLKAALAILAALTTTKKKK